VYVVDASVWVSRYLIDDEHHQPSYDWLTRMGKQTVLLASPLLLLPEVSGAVTRRAGDGLLAMRCIRELETLPYTRLFALTAERAHKAAVIAADVRVIGADATYVALADQLAMSLVTWDRQQRERAPSTIIVSSPADLLAKPPP
jgi:predicted nucleic acid-binding protein